MKALKISRDPAGPAIDAAYAAGRAEAEADLARLRAEARTIVTALKVAERNCPCGARPESFSTHSHVSGCPIADALRMAILLSETK
jgi:hypothetical protein